MDRLELTGSRMYVKEWRRKAAGMGTGDTCVLHCQGSVQGGKLGFDVGKGKSKYLEV